MRPYVIVLLLACGGNKTEAPSKGSAGGPPGSGGSAQASADDAGPGSSMLPPPPTLGRDDLLGVSSGAVVVSGAASAWRLIDEDPATGYAEDASKLAPIVIELPARVEIEQLVIDDGKTEAPDRLPQRIVVEISDKSATDGFTTIGTDEPNQPPADGVPVAPIAKPVGRWVRVTMTARGNAVELMELRAYGSRRGKPQPIDATGAYDVDGASLYLTQTGAQITGCMLHATGQISGRIDGNLARFDLPGGADVEGPAFLVFGSKTVLGYWPLKKARPHYNLTLSEVKKTSDKPGACPPGPPPVNARLYGIEFDADSDTLRDDSKPALDALVAQLKTSSSRLRIEAYTDNAATPEHDQKLSEQRAAAVKAYLVKAGIDAARLDTRGVGDATPVESNDTPIGRAMNRRIEILKI